MSIEWNEWVVKETALVDTLETISEAGWEVFAIFHRPLERRYLIVAKRLCGKRSK